MSSATPKDPEDHGKQLWWWTKNSFPGEENTFTTVGQIKNTLSGGRCMCVKVNNQRRLHQSEYRGFTTRCKPLVSSKQEGQIRVAKRHLKSLHRSGTTSYGQMRPRSTCTRLMGREEYGEGKELLLILSIPPHQWSMVVVVSWRGMYGCQWNWFSCIYWWCDCWQKQQDEFWSVLGNIICSYSAKCFRTHWTALHSADGQWPKAYCKSNQRVFEGKEVDCYAMAKSITWPESDWACISLAEDKTEGKMPQEQAGTEDGCSRGLAEHHQGWNPASGDVYAFQTSGCNWLQRICNQVLKSESLIYDYYSVPLLLVP